MNVARSILPLTVLTVLATILISFTFFAPAYAQTPKDEVCRGVLGDTNAYFQEDGKGGGKCVGGGSNGSPTDITGNNGVISNVVSLLLIVAGAISVIVLIIGGIRFMVSGGDAQAVAGARSMILYAVIGIVITFMSFAIVNFVLDQVDGPDDEQNSTSLHSKPQAKIAISKLIIADAVLK